MTHFGIIAYPHERSESSDFAGLLLGLQEPIATWWSNFPTMIWECFQNGGVLSQVVLNLWIHRPPQGCVDQRLHQHLRDTETQIQSATYSDHLIWQASNLVLFKPKYYVSPGCQQTHQKLEVFVLFLPKCNLNSQFKKKWGIWCLRQWFFFQVTELNLKSGVMRI